MAIGIIAEYNPFHNGHRRQLAEAKKRWPNEPIIVVMSGRYVQRGEIAIASFADRRAEALKWGADEVHELPFVYATQAAHIFASGAVCMLGKLGVNKLFFGSESDDVVRLLSAATAIKNQRLLYNTQVKKLLKTGISYPKACAEALQAVTGEAFEMPNDILGLEYCKVIVDQGLAIEPFTIRRNIAFHATEPHGAFASASYIRAAIQRGEDVSAYTPMRITKPIETMEMHYSHFQEIVNSKSSAELATYALMAEGMENLFRKHINEPSYAAFVAATNSKRYTSSRIKRVMLYVLLGITNDDPRLQASIF